MPNSVGLVRDSQAIFDGLDCMERLFVFSYRDIIDEIALGSCALNDTFAFYLDFLWEAGESDADHATGESAAAAVRVSLLGWPREWELGKPASTGQGTSIRFANEQGPFWFREEERGPNRSSGYCRAAPLT